MKAIILTYSIAKTQFFYDPSQRDFIPVENNTPPPCNEKDLDEAREKRTELGIIGRVRFHEWRDVA